MAAPLRERQKVLIVLLQHLSSKGIRLTKTILDKYLFLLSKEYQIGSATKFYNFYPYKYGPFSNSYYLDLNDLVSRACINESLEPTDLGSKQAKEFYEKYSDQISGLVGRFESKDILDYVYSNYPDYTVKSLLRKTARKRGTGIFTIGYEKKDIDLFLDLLVRNSIDLLVDVRYNPFSMNFQFIGSRLEKSLSKVDINYLHIPSLGIPDEKRKKLVTKEDYLSLFEYYSQEILDEDGLTRLMSLGSKQRIALMCFESDKDCCHRGVITNRLESRGIKVVHL